MRLKLQVTLWICVFNTLYCESNNSEFQSNVNSYIRDICHVDCSETSGEELQVDNLIGNTCCKGCPCDDSCSVERVAESFSDLVECRVPTPNNTFYWGILQYKFVVNEPSGGCVKDHILSTKDDHPSCSPEMVTSLGSNFYPVYSPDKQVNFKNKNCALCHGAKDLVYWDVYSTYKGKKARDLQTITNNYYNFDSDEMFTWLEAPNRESRRYTNICFPVQDQCKPENDGHFKFPNEVNMTKDEVIRACEQGPRFLYNVGIQIKWYKNVFCALCNGAPFQDGNLNYCKDNEDMRNKGVPFTFLLKRDYIHTENEHIPTSRRKVIWACTKDNNQTDDDSCREVLCPLLQVRLHDGRCDYPFDTFQIDTIKILLNLTTHDTFDSDVLVTIPSPEIRNLFKRQSPWPKIWKILDIKIRNDIIVTNRTEFLVNMALFSPGSVNFTYLQDSVKETISKPWILYLNVNEPITFSQQMYLHGKQIMENRNTKSFTPAWSMFTTDISFMRDVKIPSWRSVFVDRVLIKNAGSKIDIEKAFLCDQIQLKPREYVYKRDDVPLFIKPENRVLYPNEYHVYQSETDGEIVVICLEDSVFKTELFGNYAETVMVTRKYTLVMSLSIFFVRLLKI